MKTLCIILLWVCTIPLFADQGVTFRTQDQRIIVYQGDTVAILADSAYVIGMEQARQLNHKLLELRAAQETNHQLIQANAELRYKVAEIEGLVARLLQKLQTDHHTMNHNLHQLILELDQSIVFLRQSNTQLSANNQSLHNQLSLMNQTIKHLRKENRRMGWRHTRNKIAIALAAFGLGVLMGG